MSRPDQEALLGAPLARAVLAELIGLDPYDLLAGQGAAASVITAAVARADLGRLAGCHDPLALLAAVARVAEGEQALAEARLAEGREALRPVARALAAAPAAQWWWEPPDRSRQRWVGLEGTTPPRGADVAAAVSRVIAEEDEPAPQRRLLRRGRDAPRSGYWWSPPLGGTVFTTTGPVGGLPAVELGVAEDNAGDETFEVWAVGIEPGARIREIGGPADWARLTAEFPRDVTASRHDDWARWTGRPGPWTLPDWPSAARAWDGIHLSVAGYLLASREALAVGDGWTLLAGWDADQTLWLNDVFTGAEHVASWHGSPGHLRLT
jgi:hypothetical protein